MTEAPNPTPEPPAAPPGPPPQATAAPTAHRPGGAFDPATRRQTLIVAAILAAMFFGTQVIDEALPAAAAQGSIATVPGDAVPIGNGWQITPLGGWLASAHDRGLGIRLEKGVVVVDLFPEPYGSAGELATGYLDQALKANATQLTASDIGAATEPGGSAARFTYQGIFQEADGSIEGEVTAIVAGGDGVVADAWSGQGDLGGALDEIHQMVESIVAAR
ncbi:MAG TPA: hypothetical protein VE011_11275 [Candidatus Dormibacteraeota bacterium]|nr:hypothetical protein [Candidatus Dormibacteraeota bacterium]